MQRGDRTLPEILERRLLENPREVVCELVHEEAGPVSVTVADLMTKVMAFARRLGPRRVEREVVGVCLYHGGDLHAAFLGALWAGHIPTMLAPPSPRMEPAKYAGAFERMVEHIQPTRIVVDAETAQRLAEVLPSGLRGVELVDPREATDVSPLEPYRADPREVAVLQHSSGTTGLQKGIALSHEAILAHDRVYAKAIGLRREDVIVSWLPLYHDMGFIACFLLPLLEGVRFVQISPFHWVRKPHVLLHEIARTRGTLAWLPNFAFQFMADSVTTEQVPAAVDLSAMRAFVNCSEPVSHLSMKAFVDRFRANGIDDGRIATSYAMAENVFAVSQSVAGGARTLQLDAKAFAEHRVVLSDEGLPFVSNGPVVEGSELRVIDGSDRPLPDGYVGELAIRGGYRFSGYHGRPDLTAASITADGWYRTGDLGFVHAGEVYVTGRKKDLIIVQGRNFYPTDIERAVVEVPGVTPGRVVAFGVWNTASGTEDLVILAESDLEGRDRKMLALRVRGHVAQTLDCTPADVRIVPARWLVKSTSGKLARGDNRDKYLSTRLTLER